MTNSVSSNRSEKYNIAAFFSGVGGIELGFEQTNEFRVVSHIPNNLQRMLSYTWFFWFFTNYKIDLSILFFILECSKM